MWLAQLLGKSKMKFKVKGCDEQRHWIFRIGKLMDCSIGSWKLEKVYWNKVMVLYKVDISIVLIQIFYPTLEGIRTLKISSETDHVDRHLILKWLKYFVEGVVIVLYDVEQILKWLYLLQDFLDIIQNHNNSLYTITQPHFRISRPLTYTFSRKDLKGWKASWVEHNIQTRTVEVPKWYLIGINLVEVWELYYYWRKLLLWFRAKKCVVASMMMTMVRVQPDI